MLLFTSVIVFLYFALDDSLIGLVTSLAGMLCVVLVAKGKISNFYFGIVNVSLYAYLSYQQGLQGEFQLNLFIYLPMQFIGYYFWRKNNEQITQAKPVPKVKKLTRIHWIMGIPLLVAAVIGYGYFLQSLNANQPFLDSTTTILSITAQILLTLRFAEQWLVWIVVNVLSIILWTNAYLTPGNDIAILVMWVAYLVNSIYGYVNWLLLHKKTGASRGWHISLMKHKSQLCFDS
jgi:nicotinamide mononucleotide transporter